MKKAILILTMLVTVCFSFDYSDWVFGETNDNWFSSYGSEEWQNANEGIVSSLQDYREYGQKALYRYPTNTTGHSFISQAWIKLDTTCVDTMSSSEWTIWNALAMTTYKLGMALIDNGTQLEISSMPWGGRLKYSNTFPSLADNKWHYVVANQSVGDSIGVPQKDYYGNVYDTFYYSIDTIRFFVDGQQVGQDTVYRGASYTSNATYSYIIGGADTVTLIKTTDTIGATVRKTQSQFPGWIGALVVGNEPKNAQYILDIWNMYKFVQDTVIKNNVFTTTILDTTLDTNFAETVIYDTNTVHDSLLPDLDSSSISVVDTSTTFVDASMTVRTTVTNVTNTEDTVTIMYNHFDTVTVLTTITTTINTTVTKTIIVNTPTEQVVKTVQPLIRMFPNPATVNGMKSFYVNNVSGKINIRIYSVNGKLIQLLSRNNSGVLVTTKKIGSGVYFAKVTNRDIQETIKFMIVK